MVAAPTLRSPGLAYQRGQHDVVTLGQVGRLFAVVMAGCLPGVVGYQAVRSAAALFALARSAHPYFVPAHAALLYLWTPVVVASVSLLFLSPGLFLSLAFDLAHDAGQWIVSAFILSLLVVSAAAAVVQSLMAAPLRGGAFAAVVLGCSVLCFGCLLARRAAGRSLAWPLHVPYATVTLVSMLVVPLLLLIALTPKFYWENFNGDGVHAFESSRLLLVQPVPFWPGSAGDIASFPGVTSMLFAYPTSWFIRLFGEVEAAARLPFLLELVALYAVILALVEHNRTMPLGAPERWLVWLGLSVYAVVMAFSATYSPYSADIALPATQDTLAVVCFLGAVLGFLRGAHLWTLLCVALTFVGLPNGGLLVALWLLSVLLTWTPRPWKRVAVIGGAALICVAATSIAPRALAALQLPVPGTEYALANLITRFAFLQWADARRLAFLIVPCGILPALALVAWRWQDRLTRALSLVTVAYFGFFYVQAHIALHHFVPVMILPLVVFWRTPWRRGAPRRVVILIASAAAGVLAMLISLPSDATPDMSAWRVGAAIEDRMDGYDSLQPAAFRRALMLRYLFPLSWNPRVPDDSYGGAALVWNYYAHRSDRNSAEPNYILQPADAPAAAGLRLLAREGDAALYVRSDAVWDSHRAMRPPTPAGSPLYVLPRGVVFGRDRPAPEELRVVDVRAVLRRLGIDVEALLRRFGIDPRDEPRNRQTAS